MKPLLCLIVVLQMLQFGIPGKGLPREIYLQQQDATSCTLCASTMMLRSFLYHHDDPNWDAVKEADVRPNAWTSEGLSWEWRYETGEYTLTVSHKSVSSLNQKELESILQEHPEGIVLYCGADTHHGVFLMECVDGQFYCADPASGYAGERILLSRSLLADRLGSKQGILDAVTDYWYVEAQ